MQPEEQYHTLLQRVQRPINCLTDEDRNIRRNGLSSLTAYVKTMYKGHLVKLMNSTSLSKYLVRVFEDKIEANRYTALDIVGIILSRLTVQDICKDEIEPILRGIISRINNTPFPYKNEVLRMKCLYLLKQSLMFLYAIMGNVVDICNALALTLLDPSADIKMASCDLIYSMCGCLRAYVGKHATAMVKSLAVNLGYRKFLVRKKTLLTLGKLLVAEGAGANFEHVQTGLKKTLSDYKIDVRTAALACCAYLVNYMAPKYLRMYESVLVGNLVCGLTDEAEKVVYKTKESMTSCGYCLMKMDSEYKEGIQEKEGVQKSINVNYIAIHNNGHVDNSNEHQYKTISQ